MPAVSLRPQLYDMIKTSPWNVLWARRRQLLLCALVFQTFESLCFVPLLGLAGHALLGRPVVDSTQLVAFVLSPRGFVLLFLVASLFLMIRLLEHGGLSVIALGALQGKTVRSVTALRLMLYKLPRLAFIGACAIGCGLLIALPTLGVAAFYASRLLRNHDINFYIATRPPEFLRAAVVAGLMAAATVAIGVWLFVRWRLAVQVCMFDAKSGPAIFLESARLSRGVWWPLAWRCALVFAFQSALALLAAALGQFGAWLVLDVSGLALSSLAISFGLLVLLRTIISAAVTSTAACVDAGVFTTFYRRRRNAFDGEPALPGLANAGATEAVGALGYRTVAAMIIALFVSAVTGACAFVSSLKQEHPITVTAHRGGHVKAPENTAASIREAIAVGAQYAEIDVQISKDGVLVVTHDSDFSRMAGVARKVWDLTYDEIRAIPLGGRSDPEFRREFAPTFDQVLGEAKDHIKLNVELKYYGDHQPRLAERVVQEIRTRGMTNEVIIQCLEYAPLQEVQRFAPEIPVGYLLSVNARRPARLKVNFLGTALSRANGAFVRTAHRQGQQVHVWTVNKTEAMQRMIDVGADSLITDCPAEAVRLVHQYNELSPGERTLRRVRAWIAD
ncbi:MAG: glycerophosphodiester phosphodiesterase family protein [Chthoniobacterales bacterium]